jgi:hypothetical protein
MQDAEDSAGGTPPARAVVPSPRPAGQSAQDGSASVDGVLQDLESLDDLDVGEHVAVYGRMHTALTDVLARTADSGPDSDR